MEYKLKRFDYRPSSVEEAIQQAIAWYIKVTKQLPAGVLVNPTQYEAATVAIPNVQADLIRKFDGQASELSVGKVGGVLAWEIGVVVDDKPVSR